VEDEKEEMDGSVVACKGMVCLFGQDSPCMVHGWGLVG